MSGGSSPPIRSRRRRRLFVLSGFLVGGSAIERSGGAKPWVQNYLIDRTSRIYGAVADHRPRVRPRHTIGRRLFASRRVRTCPSMPARSIRAWIDDPWSGPGESGFDLRHECRALVARHGILVLHRLRAADAAASPCYSAGARWAGLLGLAIFCALRFLPAISCSARSSGWLLGALTRVPPRPHPFEMGWRSSCDSRPSSAIRLLPAARSSTTIPQGIAGCDQCLLFANILLTLRFDTGRRLLVVSRPFSPRSFRFFLHALCDAHAYPVFLWALIAAFAGAHAWRMQLDAGSLCGCDRRLLFCMACAWGHAVASDGGADRRGARLAGRRVARRA